MDTQKVPLTTGVVVLCRQVPPYALVSIHKQVSRPDYPIITERSKAGGAERLPALRDSDEWKAYQAALDDYKQRVFNVSIVFHLTYGVVGWWLKGEDSEVAAMHTDVPEGWRLDPVLMRLANVTPAESADERRTQYLMYEVLINSTDVEAVEAAIGLTGGKPANLITQGDIDAALAPFESKTAKGGPSKRSSKRRQG